jgi:copper chaperone CopZ
MKASLIASVCLITLNTINWLPAAAKEINEKEAPTGASTLRRLPNNQLVQVEKPKHYDKTALHRLDFRIKGKSCAVCLMGIQRRINSLDGTVKVAIMLKKPYGASIIYDSKQLTEEKLLATAKLNEPMVQLLDVKDEAIDKLPPILIPPHTNVPEFNNNSALLPSN